jgi:hypothetical protein
MINRFCGLTLCLLVVAEAVIAQSNVTAKARSIPAQPVNAVESDRTKDGLVGPVRRVRTEVANLQALAGACRKVSVTLELAAYDLRGNKIENQYFPIAGSTLTGKEVYKYDEKEH